MGRFRGTPTSSGVRTLALALASVGLVAGVQVAQAATIGHARLVSGPGEPLRIVVPVHELPAPEAETLRVSIPPASDWAAAGLSPPVSLESLGFDIAPGFAPETRLITLRSSQPFGAPVVDLLIDVSSASGRQRHQVSLLAPAGASVSPPAVASSGGSADAQGRQVRVREGDNLFGIAQRNAVPGVTVYQMMAGLYQQNPSAFIQKNLNLVRAGATLRVPDRATLTAISDREARRIFEQHARAFALYRNRLAATPDVIAAPTAEQAASGQVQSEPAVAPVPAPVPEASDRLRLSGSAAAGSAAGQAGVATGNGGGDSSSVVSSSASQAEGNGAVGQTEAAVSPGAAFGVNGRANGSAGSPVTGNAQAASQPYPGAADDDRVAQERSLDDARSRVSELEDTVRELRDALADVIGVGPSGSAAVPPTATSPAGSAGPVPSASSGAPDATRESAPAASAGEGGSVNGSAGRPESAVEAGQSAAAAPAAASGAGTSPVVPQTSSAQAVQASEATASAAASGGPALPSANGQAAGTTSRSEGEPASAGTLSATSAEGAAAAPANGGAGATASGADSAMAIPPDAASAAGAPAAVGNDRSADAAGSTLASQQSTAEETSSPDAARATAQEPARSADTNRNASTSPAGTTDAVSGGQARAGASAGQGTDTDNRARQVAEPITEKAEKTVSWLQENLIAIGGGVLALIVLFVLWLLRRSGKPADDGENAITEAMIREKLEKIDLDLSSSSESGNSRER